MAFDGTYAWNGIAKCEQQSRKKCEIWFSLSYFAEDKVPGQWLMTWIEPAMSTKNEAEFDLLSNSRALHHHMVIAIQEIRSDAIWFWCSFLLVWDFLKVYSYTECRKSKHEYKKID